MTVRMLFCLGLIGSYTIFGMQPSAKTVDDIVKEHINDLPHRNINHKPLLIVFSATAGMGKTFIAKKLAEELGASRITLDEGRIALKEYNLYPTTGTLPDKINCIMGYFEKMLAALNISSKNKILLFLMIQSTACIQK